MLNCSSLINFAGKNALPFIAGAVFGVLGYYVVQWHRGSGNSSTTFHIFDLKVTGPVIEGLTLSEFKRRVTTHQLNELRDKVVWGSRTQKIWDRIFNNSTHIVCVKKDSSLIGYGCFVGNGRMGAIYDILVHPEHQEQGIGTLIMNDIVDLIKSRDYSTINLCGWSGNPSVGNFYEKFGFVPNSYGMESHGQNLKLYNKVIGLNPSD